MSFPTFWLQAISLTAGALFCLLRAGLDLSQRRIALGCLSLIVGGLLIAALIFPIPTHAVKIDLPL